MKDHRPGVLTFSALDVERRTLPYLGLNHGNLSSLLVPGSALPRTHAIRALEKSWRSSGEFRNLALFTSNPSDCIAHETNCKINLNISTFKLIGKFLEQSSTQARDFSFQL